MFEDRKKTYPKWGNPDPKIKTLDVLLYMKMLTFKALIFNRIWITIKVRCLAQDLGRRGYPKEGKREYIVVERKAETRTAGLNIEGFEKEGKRRQYERDNEHWWPFVKPYEKLLL